MFKSLWRKPREEAHSYAGGVALRYKIDRIEAQILLLADTLFIVKVSVYYYHCVTYMSLHLNIDIYTYICHAIYCVL